MDVVVGWMECVLFVVQQCVFMIGLVVGLLVLLILVYLDNCQVNNGLVQIEIVGDMLMYLQCLVKVVLVVLLGNVNVFIQFKESCVCLQENFEVLKNGSFECGVCVLGGEVEVLFDKLIEEWKCSDKSVQVILVQEKMLVVVGKMLNVFNVLNFELLEEVEQILLMKLQINVLVCEVVVLLQLVMLMQCLGKNMNEFLVGEGVNLEMVFLFGKDINIFCEILNGLFNGLEVLCLLVVIDVEMKGYL